MGLNDILKVDIAHVGGLVVTSSADIGTIEGLANYKRAIFHRLITVPGSYVHRPDYGIGIRTYQNGLSSFSKQQKLATLIRDQIALDARTDNVGTIAIIANDENPQLTVIQISVTPKGYKEVTISFTPFSGDSST